VVYLGFVVAGLASKRHSTQWPAPAVTNQNMTD